MKMNRTKRGVTMAVVVVLVILLFLSEPTLASTRIIGRSSNNNGQRKNLKYIWQDESDDQNYHHHHERLQTAPLISYPQRATSKIHEMTNAFKQAISTSDAYSPQKEKNVHVGNLLMAMKKMEIHMRSVGMSQAANDLRGNHDKVMRLYNSAPPEKRDSVLELLKWELSTGVHGDADLSSKSPIKVKNNSGAMGMMWLQHSVRYQYDCMKLMLEKGYEPVDAAKSAFKQDLEPHMDSFSSRLAKAAIPRLTPSSQQEFFAMLGGVDHKSYGPNVDEVIRKDVRSMLGVWDDLLDSWSPAFEELRLKDI